MFQPEVSTETRTTSAGSAEHASVARDVTSAPGSSVMQLSRTLAGFDSEVDMLTHVGRALEASLKPTGLAYVWQAAEAESPRLRGFLIPVESLPQTQRDQIVACCRQASQANAPRFEPLTGQTFLTICAVPVTIGEAPRDAVVLIGRATTQGDRERCVISLLFAAEAISGWHLRQTAGIHERAAESTAALVELLAQVQAATHLEMACRVLVDLMQKHVSCTQVVLGLCEGRRSRLQIAAVSEIAEWDPKSDSLQAAAVALDECLLREAVTVWPPPDDSHRHAALGHERLANVSKSEQLITAPLRDATGGEVGAWTFLWDAPADLGAVQRFLAAAEQPIATCLQARLENEPGRIGRVARDLRRFFLRRRGQLLLAAATAVCAAMFIPLPYEVQCDCELQPVARRFVAAPYDGRLEEAFVEPGDVISKDQLLARMDGREVRWEQATALADFQRAGKERDAHMAAHDAAKAQISRLEMERVNLKRQLLEQHGQHLEICSPIDGIVVTGDLRKLEGAPLAVGETLFEVAPLDRMVFEIEIADEDISHVSVGMPISITMDAYPSQVWTGKLERIHPRTEIKDHAHVFIGELKVDNASLRLRPGMQGHARITSRQHAIGWNLFHKPWNKLMLWLGW